MNNSLLIKWNGRGGGQRFTRAEQTLIILSMIGTDSPFLQIK